MSEGSRNSASAGALVDAAQFLIRPPLRCFHREENSPGRSCEREATRRRVGSFLVRPGFYCDEHSRSGDTPIADDEVFRRVSITCDVLLSGTSWDASAAIAEALGRLERAVAAAGGVLNLHSSRSAIGAVRDRTPPWQGLGTLGQLQP